MAVGRSAAGATPEDAAATPLAGFVNLLWSHCLGVREGFDPEACAEMSDVEGVDGTTSGIAGGRGSVDGLRALDVEESAEESDDFRAASCCACMGSVGIRAGVAAGVML